MKTFPGIFLDITKCKEANDAQRVVAEWTAALAPPHRRCRCRRQPTSTSPLYFASVRCSPVAIAAVFIEFLGPNFFFCSVCARTSALSLHSRLSSCVSLSVRFVFCSFEHALQTQRRTVYLYVHTHSEPAWRYALNCHMCVQKKAAESFIAT